MRGALIAAVVLMMPWIASGSPRPAERSPAEAHKIAQEALANAIIIDTHADTPQMMLDADYDLADPHSRYMVSIPKARAGHLGAEFFSIWVPVDWPPQDLIHRALDLIDIVDQQVARHPDALAHAGTAGDIERIHREGKLAVLMGVEGGHIIEGDPRILDIFYRLGVRYMTITHTANNDLGDSSAGKPHWNGLSPLGREVVARMNRLGMMVDVSHVSDATFYAIIAATRSPAIASHSSCRALSNAPRDMTDDMIRALAKNGGVIDINYYPPFLSEAYREAHEKIVKEEDAAVAAAEKRLAAEGKRLTWPEEISIRHPYEAKLPPVSYLVIADHIDHAVKIAGMDHVGLGSDADGIEAWPQGMEDVSHLPALVEELARRGYRVQDIDKILGGNVLRVMRANERIARKLQSERGGM